MKRKMWLCFSAGVLLWCMASGAAWAQTPGTTTVRLVNGLSTEKSQAGDAFTATLAEPLVVNGRVVAPKDGRVNGRVSEAVSSGRLKRPALITLQLDSVQSSSGRYPLATEALTIKHDSHTTRNVVIIGGSAGAGAVLGGVLGGGKGAAIGAATGAGAGTLAAFLTGKQEIALPPETALTFRLTSVSVNSRELSRLPRAGEAASRTQATRDTGDDRDTRYSGRRSERRERDEGEDESGERMREREREGEIIFPPQQRTLISNWFRNSRGNLPPGLANRDRLPPGLEKQLRERGTLPPGLQKRFQPLPDDLERQLPRLPAGYKRGVVAGNVILMNDKTSVIVDIIRNVMQ
ncbi:MAG: hypothetical protein M1453_11260 [Acidobacteria bacterium]|nr:hypothetical protein [Acidobacteriota bacterium]